MTDKDKLLVAELERRLCWYRDEASEEEFDAEEVDAICVMLQKLSPIEKPRMSREEAYQNIMRRVWEEDGEEAEAGERTGEAENGRRGLGATVEEKEEAKGGSSRNRSFGFVKGGRRAAILFIAVFGAAVLSLNMVTYAREDKSLFTMILESVGVLEIVKEETGENVILDGSERLERFFDSWTGLDREIKERITVPGYIPNDFELYGIDYYDLDNRKKVKADYYDNGNGHILIEITLWEDKKRAYRENAMDESVYILLSEYSEKNVLYYEYEDEYICMISMENSFYRISGNISLDEIIKIRKGLGDVK